MAQFLTTSGTSYHVERIIIEAKNQLILVSPYLQLSKTLMERLKDTTDRNVEVVIIYGKDDLNPNQKNSLAELKTIRLLFHQNLHAKCYLNENDMVITSMNMYEFSEKNNREMGILVNKKSDLELYEQAVKEVQSITAHSERIELTRTERTFQGNLKGKYSSSKPEKNAPPSLGYCLRCETRIPYDILKPYCWDCYQVWAQFENPQYKEAFCHCCGEFNNNVCMSTPQCYKCNKKYPIA